MASRDVELIIKARDEASAVAKSVTTAFNQLATAETKVGSASEPTSTLLGELKTQLAELQAAATGLSGFSRVASSIDRADNSLTKLETNAARANDALQRSGLAAQSQSLGLARARIASDEASAALDRQRAALVKLQEQQRLQQGSVNVARQTGLGSATLPAQQVQLANLNTQVKESAAAVRAAQTNFNALQRDVSAAESALTRANAAFVRSTEVSIAEGRAVDVARTELAALKTQATDTGTALGGVSAKQEEITAASQRNAQALQQVAAAIAQERQAIAAASSADATGGAAQTATAAYRAQVAAVNAAKVAWQQATTTVAQLALQIRSTTTPTAELKAQFLLAKAAAGDAKGNFEALQQTLQRTKTTIQEAAAARASAVAKELEESNAVKQAKSSLDAYNASLAGTVRNLIGLKNPAQQAAAALAAASAATARSNNAAAGGANGAFLGLTPSKLQNLSFQVNDIITQISSGTSIQQTLAQQSAQIGQLFPSFNNLLITGLRLLPALAAVAAALAPFIAAFGRINAEANNTRKFNTQLEATGQTALATGHQLALTAEALDQYGIKMKDAVAIEQQFLTQGIAASHFEQLAEAAKNLAPALGTDIPTAAQRLSSALTGNLDDVLKLDEQLNFLTHSEREQIRALSESVDASTQAERASKQRQIVEAALLRQSDTIASNSRGPWSSAAREFGRAWNDLVGIIANTGVFQAAGRAIDGLADRVTSAAHNFRVGLAFLSNGFNGQQAVSSVSAADRGGRAGGDARDPNSQAAQRAAEAREATQRQFNNQLDREEATRLRIAAATRVGKVAGAEQRAEEDLRTRAIAAGVVVTDAQVVSVRNAAAAQERANAAQHAGASEAQSLARRQQAFNLELTKGNEQRALEARLVGETARQQAIDNAVDQVKIRAEQQRVTLTDAQTESVRASAAALFDAQQSEQQRNSVLEQQIQLRQLLHQQVSADQQLQEEALLQNIDLTSDYGKAWAAARREVIDTTNQIDNLSRAQQDVSTRAAGLREGERNFRTAQDNGESRAQLDARHTALVQQSEELIRARDAAIALAQALGDTNAVQALQAVNVEVRTQRDEVLSAADAAKQLSSGLAGGIGDAATEIGKAIDGTQEWGDALHNIGDIFRQFASDFLKQIAQMIIQALILRAIQSSGAGGFISGIVGGLTKHGGGVVGSGGFHRDVPTSSFAGAPRFHEGGIAGLRPGEVPSILQRGEEVLTANDPRHVANGGKSGGAPPSVKVVNVLDSGDIVQHGLSTTAGEKAFFNFIRQNKTQVKAEIG